MYIKGLTLVSNFHRVANKAVLASEIELSVFSENSRAKSPIESNS